MIEAYNAGGYSSPLRRTVVLKAVRLTRASASGSADFGEPEVIAHDRRDNIDGIVLVTEDAEHVLNQRQLIDYR